MRSTRLTCALSVRPLEENRLALDKRGGGVDRGSRSGRGGRKDGSEEDRELEHGGEGWIEVMLLAVRKVVVEKETGPESSERRFSAGLIGEEQTLQMKLLAQTSSKGLQHMRCALLTQGLPQG